MAKKNYRHSIPWKVLENYFLIRRQDAFMQSLEAEGLREVGLCQGKAMAFNDLLNLPETLELREADIEDLDQ